MENLQELIISYGYLAVLVGTFLEGETLLLLAGFIAQQGMMDLSLVMVFATLGATAGDQTYFYLGRYRRDWLFARFPGLRKKADRVYHWVEKHPDLIIIGSRFVYGFRIVTPIVLGTSRVPALRYSLFNFIGAMIWAVGVSSAGYFLGNVAEKFLGNLHKIQKQLFLGILAVGFVLWLIHRIRARREMERQKVADTETPA